MEMRSEYTALRYSAKLSAAAPTQENIYRVYLGISSVSRPQTNEEADVIDIASFILGVPCNIHPSEINIV